MLLAHVYIKCHVYALHSCWPINNTIKWRHNSHSRRQIMRWFGVKLCFHSLIKRYASFISINPTISKTRMFTAQNLWSQRRVGRPFKLSICLVLFFVFLTKLCVHFCRLLNDDLYAKYVCYDIHCSSFLDQLDQWKNDLQNLIKFDKMLSRYLALY